MVLMGGFFVGVIGLAPTPMGPTDTRLLVQNPLLLKALLGPFHTLGADGYWLRGARLGPNRLFEQAKIITTLDPNFTLSLRYSTTYLASIQGRVDLAHALCDIAIMHNPQQSYPYLLKISHEMGYQQPYRYAKVIAWIKQVKTMTRDAPIWLNALLLHARTQLGQTKAIRQDLQWLLTVASGAEERQLIQAKIAALD